jgi:hypothetical protein
MGTLAAISQKLSQNIEIMNENQLTKLDAITNLLKVILWPLVLIIVIILFWKPINNLLNNSETISFGNFTLKIKEEIPIPSDNVKKVVSKISDKGFEELLYIGKDTIETNMYNRSAFEDAPMEELKNLGLIKYIESQNDTIYLFETTKLGAETCIFYISLINAVAKKVE